MPQSSQGTIPPNINQQQSSAPQQHQQPIQAQSARFHTPAGHFSNPVNNVWAATHNFSLIPIHGNSPLKVEARKAIEMMQDNNHATSKLFAHYHNKKNYLE